MSKRARSRTRGEVVAKRARVTNVPEHFPWLELLADVQGVVRGELAYNDAYVLSRTCRAEAAKFTILGPQHVKAFVDTLMAGGSVAQAKWFSHVLRWSYYENHEYVSAVDVLYKRGCPDDPYYHKNSAGTRHPVLRSLDAAIDSGHADLLVYCKENTTLMRNEWRNDMETRALTVPHKGVIKLLVSYPSCDQFDCIGLSGNRVAVEMFWARCCENTTRLSCGGTIYAIHTGDVDFLAFLLDKKILRIRHAHGTLFSDESAMPLVSHLDKAMYDTPYPPLAHMVCVSELEANKRKVAAFLIATTNAEKWARTVEEGTTEALVTYVLGDRSNLEEIREPRNEKACVHCGKH